MCLMSVLGTILGETPGIIIYADKFIVHLIVQFQRVT